MGNLDADVAAKAALIMEKNGAINALQAKYDAVVQHEKDLVAHCIEVTGEGVAAVDRYNEHALEETPDEDTKAHVDEYRKSLHSAEGSLDHELHVLEFVTEMLGTCV